MTTERVRRVTFRRSGVDGREVYRYLRRVADEWDLVVRELAVVREENARLKAALRDWQSAVGGRRGAGATLTPQPGMVLVLADDQYRFGAGPLLCRVVEVIAPVLFDEVLWWHVSGECAYGTAERHGGWQARELYVVDAAVRGGHRREGKR